MRVVIVIPYFYPKVGGLENYAFEIVKGLINDFQCDIWVITSNHVDNSYLEEEIQKIKVIRLPVQFKLSNTPVNLLWYWDIKKTLNEISPDVVVSHTPVPFISDMASLAAGSLKIPHVITYQNDLIKDNVILKFITYAYSSTLGKITLDNSKKIIVTTSEYASKSSILKPFLKKIAVIPPGVHLKLVSSKKTTKPYILFVGQLDKTHQHKGLDILIKALSEIQERCPNLELVVIGKGDDLERYKMLARQFGINSKVHFEGYVTDDAKNQYYASALCLCLPSTSVAEGFGMVILEAATQKTPSIGSNLGGISVAIQDKKTGILVHPNDSQDLSRAIRELYENPEQRKTLGIKAFERVQKEFLWSDQVKKTYQVLKEVL